MQGQVEDHQTPAHQIARTRVQRQRKAQNLAEWLTVNNKGWITTTSEGKNRWHVYFKGEVLRWLDISIVNFSDQHSADWGKVMKDVSDSWEYVGNEGRGVVSECLELYAQRILKTKRYNLSQLWKE